MDYFKALLILFSILGFSYGDLSSKIVGGYEVMPHSAPFMVSIARMRDSPEIHEHFCGGSILNVQWVLGAAHCLERQTISELMVIAGQHNRTSDNPDNRQYSPVEAMYFHPNWDSTGPGIANDISTIKLRDQFTFNEFVSAINLPQEDEISFGPAAVYGWGRINHEEPWEYSDVLKTLTVNVGSFEECVIVMKRFNLTMQSNNLCAVHNIEDSAFCNADSGGPLIIGEGPNKRLIGIVSWSTSADCGRVDSVDVYVRVSAFIQWIKDGTSHID